VTGDQDLRRPLVAEALGTALLVAMVVGSGIMAERLAGGDAAIALLANTIATGGGLVALILTFGGISGAHFNPVVTLSAGCLGQLPWKQVPTYLLAQCVGGLGGVAVAHGMFGLQVAQFSTHMRAGQAQAFSELVATLGLVVVIWGCSSSRPETTPFAVGAYITAAYWFTASTSFANPAVTLARSLSDTFAGIRPEDVPLFVVAQLIGGGLATWLCRWMKFSVVNRSREKVTHGRPADEAAP
jgi:glycerol uptake facilitator-like aquaporin